MSRRFMLSVYRLADFPNQGAELCELSELSELRLARVPLYNASHGRLRQQEAQRLLELAAHPSCLRPALPRYLRAGDPCALWLPFLLLVSVCLGVPHRSHHWPGLLSS